jgi:hypothetical protein
VDFDIVGDDDFHITDDFRIYTDKLCNAATIILNFKKIIPDTCALILKNIDGNGTDTIIIEECGDRVPINAYLGDSCCIKFVH